MKRIAVLQFAPLEGPGYFSSFIAARGGTTHLIALYAGDPLPTDPTAYDGWCLMGGPMSVNDPLPWIPPLLTLIRRAVESGIPVIGHCLGGQLLAKALGASVAPNPTKEIGWGEVWVTDPDAARPWLGDLERFTAFHWHGETFSIPPSAKCWLTSRFCAHQAFSIGPHLGLQCHVEMTEAMIADWCREWAAENAPVSEAVAPPDRILAQTPDFLPQLRAVADRLYTAWWRGVLHER
ncbi:MAG: type 1 glutamine amidotransferase [Hydrogenophilus sp.]|nr:type 1 glutamine amidotransferase [Hydrogenophilus sp.]